MVKRKVLNTDTYCWLDKLPGAMWFSGNNYIGRALSKKRNIGEQLAYFKYSGKEPVFKNPIKQSGKK